MFKLLARCALVSFILWPCLATAGPIELKLAFFSSDQSNTYLAAVKPFVDAVNLEGKGQVEIVLYSGGVLGKEIARQPQVVIDGKADLAFIVPGYTPAMFPDNSVVELPGLFRDMREATRVYTQLIAMNALRGYEDFVVIGAYVAGPETLHSRLPIASIEDLKGKKIRVNNPGEAAALERLGALPVPMEITRIAEALSSGEIDGAVTAITPLDDYGISRVATHHYFLCISGAPLALVMNRAKFEALPKPAQDLIRKYGGDWAATQFIASYEASDTKVMERLKFDSKREIALPSPSDVAQAQAVFKAVVTEWLAKSPRHQEIFETTEGVLAQLRATH